MVFNAIFNSILVISPQPVHLSMLSWSSFNHILSKPLAAFQHITIVETTDSGERGMDAVTMTFINPQKEYWLSRGSNQRPPVLKSATVPTEPLDSADSKSTDKVKSEASKYRYAVLCYIK